MALIQTSAGAWLAEDAAASYEALNVEFTDAFGRRLPITSGARSYVEQERLFRDNYTTNLAAGTGGRVWWNGTYWRRRKGSQYVVVAPPGSSMHEYPPGIAADFGGGVQTLGSAEHNWMRDNAPYYGWEWTGERFAKVEPWHWEKRHPTTAGGKGHPFVPPMNKEDAMLDGFVYQIVNPAGGLNGVLVRFGSRMSCPPAAADSGPGLVLASLVNHGIPDSVPDVVTVAVPGGGTTKLIKISEQNAYILAESMYGARAADLVGIVFATELSEKVFPRFPADG